MREVDISMVKTSYNSMRYQKNDYIGGTISLYEYHFISGAPPQTKDYLTLIKPFEPHVWGFSLGSVVAVFIALILINKMHATYTDVPLNESPYQSKDNINNYNVVSTRNSNMYHPF